MSKKERLNPDEGIRKKERLNPDEGIRKKERLNPDEGIRRKRNEESSGRNGAMPAGYYINHPSKEVFVCRHCGRTVEPAGAGTDHRNHCPNCLWSLHLDREPGDRAADCGGQMEPIAVWVRDRGEWALIHRCKSCGALSSNRIAADDNPMMLMSIAMRPISQPPFPMERMEDMMRMMNYGTDTEKN